MWSLMPGARSLVGRVQEIEPPLCKRAESRAQRHRWLTFSQDRGWDRSQQGLAGPVWCTATQALPSPAQSRRSTELCALLIPLCSFHPGARNLGSPSRARPCVTLAGNSTVASTMCLDSLQPFPLNNGQRERSFQNRNQITRSPTHTHTHTLFL